MAIMYFVKAERPRDDAHAEERGPFPEFLQLTYEDLRIGPDGEIIAQMGKEGQWYFADDDFQTPWSDIVIYAREVAE